MRIHKLLLCCIITFVIRVRYNQKLFLPDHKVMETKTMNDQDVFQHFCYNATTVISRKLLTLNKMITYSVHKYSFVCFPMSEWMQQWNYLFKRQLLCPTKALLKRLWWYVILFDSISYGVFTTPFRGLPKNTILLHSTYISNADFKNKQTKQEKKAVKRT